MGGGLAASALVAALRRRGSGAEITVLSAEALLPYDRPPLSKELFTRTEPAWLRDEFALPDDAADVSLGTSAVELTSGGVVTADGQLWEADEIVLATGVAPIAPWPGVHTLHTWEDAVGLRSALESAGSVAIIGAGWLGLELASVARERGLEVTLVDATPDPLGTVLPHAAAARIGQWVADTGIAFHGGAPVAEVNGRDVVTTAGTTVDADVIVAALGSRPQTKWLPAELLTRCGHVAAHTNGRVREGLWAIGDCAESDGTTHPHWNDAVAAAERCAAALTGSEPPPRRAPHGFSEMFRRDVQLLGTPSPTADVEFDQTVRGWVAHLSLAGELRAVLAVDSPREVAKARKTLVT
ncbi:NADPH-dependent 2,4-dienoyl-CoA reductase, sulfur reductase [Ruaniaceae bacterium KH17]|nr:NADPH-dependent 2,4-dienoyl-CoA reductase, sulfur reductase [Ruaniaceae bacterium KH17]